MTDAQKRLIKELLSGMYMMKKPNHKGEVMYKLYSGNVVPHRYVKAKVADKVPVFGLLKMDCKKRITLNLSSVRKLHGKSWIKQQYKQLNKKS